MSPENVKRGLAGLRLLSLESRRADQMAIALDMRGFALPGRRTFLLDRPVGARDAVVVVIALAAPASSWAMRAAGFGLVAG